MQDFQETARTPSVRRAFSRKGFCVFTSAKPIDVDVFCHVFCLPNNFSDSPAILIIKKFGRICVRPIFFKSGIYTRFPFRIGRELFKLYKYLVNDRQKFLAMTFQYENNAQKRSEEFFTAKRSRKSLRKDFLVQKDSSALFGTIFL